MNLKEAEINIGKDVIYFPEVYDKELAQHTSNTKMCRIKSITDGDYVEVETDHGCMYIKSKEIKLSNKIEFLPEHEDNMGNLSVKIDTNEVKDMLNQVEIRKEVVFLLIQNNYAIDSDFEYTVDRVLYAIGALK